LQLRVLRLGFLQDGDVGVGVFLEGEEIFVGGFRLGGIACHGVGTTELQMGQRAERKVEHDPAVVNDPLELRGRRAAVVCHELSKSTSKKSTLQKLSSPPFEDANKNMGTARQCESSTSCVSFWDERELLVE
jgi:hypothetical protein